MSEEKNYTCKHCGQKFTNRYKLTGHSTHCDKNPNKLTVNNLEVYNKNHKQKIEKIIVTIYTIVNTVINSISLGML